MPAISSHSLRFRLVLIVSLFTLAISFAVGGMFALHERNEHRQISLEKAQILASSLAGSALIPLFADDRERLARLTTETAGYSGVSQVTITTVTGNVVAQARQPSYQADTEAIHWKMPVRASSKRELSVQSPETPATRGSALGYVNVTMDNRKLQKSIQELAITTLLLAFLFWGLISYLGYHVIHWVTRSLTPLLAGIRIMQKGDYVTRITPSGDDELTEVTSAINELAQVLQQRETALKESELRFRTMADFAHDWEYWVAPDRQLLYISPSCQRITGYGTDDFYSRPELLDDLIHPDDQKAWLAHTEQILEYSGPLSVDFRIIRNDGEIRWISHVCQNISDEQGQKRGRRVNNRDVSERKRLESERHEALEAAKAASRAKSEFLANMSHEIRTPMNAIIGLGHLALQTKLSPQQRDYLIKIEGAGHALINLINDILDLSKVEAGMLTLEQTEFSLPGLLEQVTALCAVPGRAKRLKLQITRDSRVPERLVGDPYRLQQILQNLLGNAVKFTREGKVTLSVGVAEEFKEQEQVMLTFAVRDTGIGLSAEQIATLFQPFTQADGSITRQYGGTGLGLSICRQLVALMEGEITAQGTLGEGSTFTFTARFGIGAHLNEPSIPVESQPEQLPLDTAVLEGLRVLLVEDQSLNQQVAWELLTTAGVTVEIADNGEEALRMMSEQGKQYNLVLMDLQMPIMDGYTATRQIRQQWPGADLPIIAMTAHAMENERRKCLDAGMNDYLTKPIDVRNLYRTLHDWTHHQSRSGKLTAITSSEGVEEAVLPAILPGLNIAEGVARLGGNSDLYLRLVSGFARDKRHALCEIRTALTESEEEKAGHLAHGLRGIAGNIAAVRLHELLSDLEQACTQGASETIMGLLPGLEDGMKEVIDSARMLEQWQSQPPANPPLKAINLQELALLLQEMGDLALLHNLKITKRLPALIELVTGTEYAPFVCRLAESLELLDFDRAVRQMETLKELSANFGENPP
jgi:two-component system, sensor histidine kinase and response regulator